MIIHTETSRFYMDIIENGEYSYLFKDLVIIDVGCNVGIFSLWLQSFAKQIYAIDISQENIDNLNKSIEENKFDNIKTYCLGIWGYTGKGFIQTTGGLPAGDGGWKLSESGTQETNVSTLADFMKTNNIEHADVVKIDVEGNEREIINTDNFPSNKISTVLGEFHYGDERIRRDFVRSFNKMGYRFFWHINNFIARK